MRNLLLVLTVFVLASCTIKTNDSTPPPPTVTTHLDSICTPIQILESAFANQQSDLSVTVKGSITRLLSDDTVGDKHQRFIIQLSNSKTLLIAHNIDIASRVTGISVGSIVYAHGDYVWNSEGGLVHWTHHDPDGVHENGWIVVGDNTFL